MFVLALLPLLTAVGVGFDYARALGERTVLQAAADAAVLAGAALDPADRDDRAAALLRADLPATLTAKDIETSFTTHSDNSYSATVEAKVPTAILPLVGINAVPVQVMATAAKVEPGNRVCLLLVSETAGQSLLVNSGASVTAPDCEVHVRSTANPAAIVNSGTMLNVRRVCVRGSRVILNGGVSVPLEVDCETVEDPFKGRLPLPATAPCTYSNKTFDTFGGTRVMEPGTYCGWTNFNGSQRIRFLPGTYVIRNGGMTINGNSVVEGEGVTFFLAGANATFTLNGSPTLSLKAPRSGPLAGVLFYEPDGLPRSQLVFNGSVRTGFDGLLHLPSRDVTFNASSNVDGERVTMVFNTLIVNNTRWVFEGSDRAIGGGGGGARLVN